jgi:hypothetical protein
MDAAEVMNLLVRTAHGGFADDDTLGYTYTMTSISRLAACLGADFAPYLPFVLPQLMETANKEARDDDATICTVPGRELNRL